MAAAVISGFSIFVIVLVALAVILVFMGVKLVPQGYEFTVERFGRYTRALRPGLHLIVPVVDRIGAKMNMMEQVLDVPTQEVITRDNAMVAVDGVVFFQVMDAAKAAYEVRDLTIASLNLAMTNLRTVMGSMDLDELLSQRDAINARLLTVIDEATTPWGVKVTRVEIRDISPPRDLVEAMGRQMKAEREKRAQVLEAEGDRAAEILRAEGQKQATVLEAEGRREAAFRDAEARERLAKAEAEATQMVSEAIASGDMQAVNYFVAQKYVDALQNIGSADNSKIVLMPLEAASVIGSIGGIGQISKDLFGNGDGGGGNGSRPTPPRRPSPGPAAVAPRASVPTSGPST
ncbi:MAG: SPFH/Band 7/PHB domain protein [Minwuiales bacterium]|nr:SPFH/Band 7/PHB domain protein [Minwuiales bacterium]